ncbi:cytochrome c-type biogenesis protein CcmH [Rhizobium aquaticum]|uniref:Cytochrome c-type biogenesis protein n=1 Tax=Rhizobium aquaticum TaxID=1549636 RepID=A0ABV2IY13_9HYPH
MIRRLVLALFLLFSAMPAHAVNPDEVLADPQLEARAREISSHLRCLVCQNQSIDDSNAELARDLRLLVRERLKAGASDQQVYDYLVSRYGEFVLLKPRLSEHTLLLWGAPAVLALIGIMALGLVAVSRNTKRKAVALTDEEKARVEALLKE